MIYKPLSTKPILNTEVTLPFMFLLNVRLLTLQQLTQVSYLLITRRLRNTLSLNRSHIGNMCPDYYNYGSILESILR